MSKEIKTINITEFRKKGYLQELNRQFLHPLGLALVVSIDEDDNEILSGIHDFREDPTGIIYDLEKSETDRIVRFNENADFIEKEFDRTIKHRMDKLGFGVEVIPTNKK